MRLISSAVFLLMLGYSLFASAATPVNLALHKPYVIGTPPNYALCTDAGDATDLTDGMYPEVPKGSSLWAVKGCVGWNHARQPVSITIDLGKIEPIGGASFSSAAGGAGVSYPSSIAISVSDDNKTFHYIGDLIELDESDPAPLYGTYSTHIFRTSQLRSRGRYVRISAISSAIFLFCDEIEVYKGDDSLLKTPAGGRVMTDAQLTDPLRLTRLGVRRRLMSDWAQVRAAIEHAAAFPQKQDLLQELDSLKTAIGKEAYPSSLSGFKAIVPLGDLDAKIFAVYGRLLAAQGVQPLTIWHSRPYQLLHLLEKPTGTLKQLKLQMMGNEHRAEAFNLTNASGQARQIGFTLDGLPDGAVSVYEVEYADTREGRPVATALMPLKPADGRYRSTVAAGMTRQIWLSVDSKDVPAGMHTGMIHVTSDSFDQGIEFQLNVAAVRMADRPALHTGMWDYIYNQAYGITAGNKLAALRDMRDHRVDTLWCTQTSTPMPKPTDFDAQGNLTGKIDYSQWDAFVRFGKRAEHYIAFPAFTATSTFAGLKPGTPQCNRAISQWAADWARHNQEIGLKPKQAMILFIDEPPTEWMQASYDLIKPFTDGTKEIAVFIDPGIHNVKDFEAARSTLDLCDVVMPTAYNYLANENALGPLYRQLQDKGVQLGLYMCTGPTRQYDPSYFRMQAWQCFMIGSNYSGFWAYGDNGAVKDSWNPYTAVGTTSYTPVFLSPHGVSGSKHWEALREGIEDYQYLVMLAQSQNAAAATRQADATVKQAIKGGLASYSDRWDDGSHFAEAARLEILKQLEQHANPTFGGRAKGTE